MSAFASLADLQVTSGTMSIPLYGVWSADVTLIAEAVIPDVTTFILGNLQLKCGIYRQSKYGGSTSCRIIGGVGGWRKSVTARQYSLSSGVNLSLILGDAAREVGESVSVTNDGPVGSDFVRMNGPASNVLRQLAGANWYVDPKGVTQNKAWPTTAVTTPFVVTDQNPSSGVITVATEDYAAWMPGCTFTSPQLDSTFTNYGVTYRFPSDGILRLEVMTK